MHGLDARQEEDVKLEKNVFEVALDRVKHGVRDDEGKEAVDAGLDKRTDILAPFMQFVQDPRRITKVGALFYLAFAVWACLWVCVRGWLLPCLAHRAAARRVPAVLLPLFECA